MTRKNLQKSAFHVIEKAGPFIGPRGGKWADAKHTIPWREGGAKPKLTVVPGGKDEKPGAPQKGQVWKNLAGKRVDVISVDGDTVTYADRSKPLETPNQKASVSEFTSKHKMASKERGKFVTTGPAEAGSDKAKAQMLARKYERKSGKAKSSTESTKFILQHYMATAIAGGSSKDGALESAESVLERRADPKTGDPNLNTLKNQLGSLYEQVQKEMTKSLSRTPLSWSDPLDFLQKAGPFIGPRGGKWADAKHTIPWKEPKGSKGAPGLDDIARHVLGPKLKQAKAKGWKVVAASKWDASKTYADMRMQGAGVGVKQSAELVAAGVKLVHPKFQEKWKTTGKLNMKSSPGKLLAMAHAAAQGSKGAGENEGLLVHRDGEHLQLTYAGGTQSKKQKTEVLVPSQALRDLMKAGLVKASAIGDIKGMGLVHITNRGFLAYHQQKWDKHKTADPKKVPGAAPDNTEVFVAPEHSKPVDLFEPPPQPYHKGFLSSMAMVKQYLTPEQFKKYEARVMAGLARIQKAGGEGSRGGKVIGHTSGGKPIYESGGSGDHQINLHVQHLKRHKEAGRAEHAKRHQQAIDAHHALNTHEGKGINAKKRAAKEAATEALVHTRAHDIEREQGKEMGDDYLKVHYHNKKLDEAKKKKKAKKLQKAAGFNLIGGRPQAQFTAYVRTPGQVPGANAPPMHIRPKLDPELDKQLNGKPPAWTAGRMLDTPVQNSWDVVRGLGLSKAMENRLRGIVSREILGSANRWQVQKSVMGLMVQEGVPSEVRGIIGQRAQKLYLKVLQKSGYREVYAPDDILELRARGLEDRARRPEKLKKGEARGGHYHARVSKEGKHRYYYDAEEYEKQHGEHSHGGDNQNAYLNKAALKCVEKAGGDCGFDAFKGLVKRFGPKQVHDAVRSHVDSGKLSFKKGKFSQGKKDADQ